MSKQVTIITGASRGIGRAIAKKLALEGHSVALTARNEELLEEVKANIVADGGEARYYVGDVTDEAFVHTAVEQIVKDFGQVDNLVNNAGILNPMPFEESTADDFRRHLEVNVLGVYHFSRAVYPHLLKQKSGAIVTVSSLAGKNGFKGGTMYSATKHAVMGFTKSLMLEAREHNIRVATVNPGSVNTDMRTGNHPSTADASTLLQPEDVAGIVAHVLALPVNALMSDVDVRPTNPKK